MANANTRQLNIRVTPEQYKTLQDIAGKAEFPTTPQTVAGSLLRDLLDRRGKKASCDVR